MAKKPEILFEKNSNMARKDSKNIDHTLRSQLVIVIFLFFVITFHLLLYISVWGQRFELRSTDYFFRLFYWINEPKAPSEIAIVAMDDSSYQLLNIPFDKAWPRGLHAELIRKLKALGAKKV
ncbi:MAG: CHASE2 domain-containing protein, partial [SAR324 cluster bacterium]|nr:CHASE2 domain-containing protein [SAR324 cluster bacterium]